MLTRAKQLSFDKYFLILVGLLYLVLLSLYPGIFYQSLGFAGRIFLKIIPVFVFVFVVMALVNYFVTRDWVVKHLGGKGVKKWIFAVVGGVISTGPIYVWYPLLGDLKEKGMSDGLSACFLYNRAVKIPLLPIAIYYFGWQFILILIIVMMVVSVIQGIIMEKIL